MAARRGIASILLRASTACITIAQRGSIAPQAASPFIRSDLSTIVRTFRTSFYLAANSSLSEAIRNEIDYEKENYVQPEVRVYSKKRFLSSVFRRMRSPPPRQI